MQDPKHCSASLLQLLLRQLTSPNEPPITRSAAAAYVASFLARAAYVPEPILIDLLQVQTQLLPPIDLCNADTCNIATWSVACPSRWRHLLARTEAQPKQAVYCRCAEAHQVKAALHILIFDSFTNVTLEVCGCMCAEAGRVVPAILPGAGQQGRACCAGGRPPLHTP